MTGVTSFAACEEDFNDALAHSPALLTLLRAGKNAVPALFSPLVQDVETFYCTLLDAVQLCTQGEAGACGLELYELQEFTREFDRRSVPELLRTIQDSTPGRFKTVVQQSLPALKAFCDRHGGAQKLLEIQPEQVPGLQLFSSFSDLLAGGEFMDVWFEGDYVALPFIDFAALVLQQET